MESLVQLWIHYSAAVYLYYIFKLTFCGFEGAKVLVLLFSK